MKLDMEANNFIVRYGQLKAGLACLGSIYMENQDKVALMDSVNAELGQINAELRERAKVLTAKE